MLIRCMPLCAAFVLAGCATQYQSSGLTGGHVEMKGPPKLETVLFSANGYTSAELTQKYALYRCAEVAKAKGKPYFVMYSSLLAAAHDRPSSAPRVGKALNKPVATAFVLMLDAPRAGALNTSEVIAELQKIVDSGSLER